MNGELVHIKFTYDDDTSKGIGEATASNVISEREKGLTVQNRDR
jgi:hypothetical protein